jgi:hypothetical protein
MKKGKGSMSPETRKRLMWEEHEARWEPQKKLTIDNGQLTTNTREEKCGRDCRIYGIPAGRKEVDYVE